ncbi:hypothetical protein ACKKBG_A18920 [Auxenochlorella protothecoides x Auxenochlorella symbiontica]
MPPRGRCFLVTLLVLATALGARASIAAPVITNVEPGNQQVTLSYQRIPTSVPPVRQMSIACTDTRITPDPQNAEQQVSVLPNATSVTITGLTNGIYYTCTLKARAWTSNSLFAPVTQSPTSESSPAFMPTASAKAPPKTSPSLPPRSLPAPINIDLEPGQDGTSITVRFDPPKDGAAAISYYVVACAPTAANSGAVSPASRVVPASNATLASEVKGLTTAVEYKCGVQARSSTSSSSTASASVVTGTTSAFPAGFLGVCRGDWGHCPGIRPSGCLPPAWLAMGWGRRASAAHPFLPGPPLPARPHRCIQEILRTFPLSPRHAAHHRDPGVWQHRHADLHGAHKPQPGTRGLLRALLPPRGQRVGDEWPRRQHSKRAQR